MNYILIFGLLILCILDLKYKKVFNIIAYPIIFFGIFLNIHNWSLYSLFNILISLILGSVIWYVTYNLNFCKFGEFKLFIILFLFGNFYFSTSTIIISYLLIFLIKMFSIIKTFGFKELATNTHIYLLMIFQYGIRARTIYDELSEVKVIPYSLILLNSVIIGLLLNS